MRTYEQLNGPEQAAAVEYCLTDLLRAILKGGLRFAPSMDNLQARIDAALDEAERMQTPWFANEYIMESAGEELRSMAQCNAEDAQYADAGDTLVIRVAEL